MASNCVWDDISTSSACFPTDDSTAEIDLNEAKNLQDLTVLILQSLGSMSRRMRFGTHNINPLVVALISAVSEHLESEENIVTVQHARRIVVVGDIHGKAFIRPVTSRSWIGPQLLTE